MFAVQSSQFAVRCSIAGFISREVVLLTARHHPTFSESNRRVSSCKPTMRCIANSKRYYILYCIQTCCVTQSHIMQEDICPSVSHRAAPHSKRQNIHCFAMSLAKPARRIALCKPTLIASASLQASFANPKRQLIDTQCFAETWT